MIAIIVIIVIVIVIVILFGSKPGNTPSSGLGAPIAGECRLGVGVRVLG